MGGRGASSAFLNEDGGGAGGNGEPPGLRPGAAHVGVGRGAQHGVQPGVVIVVRVQPGCRGSAAALGVEAATACTKAAPPRPRSLGRAPSADGHIAMGIHMEHRRMTHTWSHGHGHGHGRRPDGRLRCGRLRRWHRLLQPLPFALELPPHPERSRVAMAAPLEGGSCPWARTASVRARGAPPHPAAPPGPRRSPAEKPPCRP